MTLELLPKLISMSGNKESETFLEESELDWLERKTILKRREKNFTLKSDSSQLDPLKNLIPKNQETIE